MPFYFFTFLSFVLLPCVAFVQGRDAVSAVGDPGMTKDGLRVAFEAWNFCNEVGKEAPAMGSPRAADCFDLSTINTEGGPISFP